MPATVPVDVPVPEAVAATVPASRSWADPAPDTDLTPARPRQPAWATWDAVQPDLVPSVPIGGARSYTEPLDLGPPARHAEAGLVRFGITLIFVSSFLSGLSGIVASTQWSNNAKIIGALIWSLIVYWLVAQQVKARLAGASFKPEFSIGDRFESILIGVLTGGTIISALLFFFRQDGKVTADSDILFIVSERTPIRILLAFLVAVVAAPLVEELMFRGLLGEGLRPKGLIAAGLISGSLFAVAHQGTLGGLIVGFFTGEAIYFMPYVYYTIGGLVFFALYVKRGLVASIAAHAVFNGVILLTAVMITMGPSHTVTQNAVSVKIPGTWQMMSPEEAAAEVGSEVDFTVDLAVIGPSGAALIVGHEASPAPGASAHEFGMWAGEAGMAEAATGGPFGVRSDLPFGDAVMLQAEDGHETYQVYVVPKGDTLWTVILSDGGSGSARGDWDPILTSIVLPDQPAGASAIANA